MSQAGIRTPSQGPSSTPDKTNSIHNTDAWRHLIRDYGHPDNSASQITGSQELKYRRPRQFGPIRPPTVISYVHVAYDVPEIANIIKF